MLQVWSHRQNYATKHETEEVTDLWVSKVFGFQMVWFRWLYIQEETSIDCRYGVDIPVAYQSCKWFRSLPNKGDNIAPAFSEEEAVWSAEQIWGWVYGRDPTDSAWRVRVVEVVFQGTLHFQKLCSLCSTVNDLFHNYQ